MDKEIKQQKKHIALKVILGATALSTVLYFGNAFNLKNHVNRGFSGTRNAVVDVFTKDVGELSTRLYNKVRKAEDVNQYKDEIQKMMYVINDRFAPENQFTTIDGLIERVAPDVQQRITDSAYNRQDLSFKAEFTEQHFNDVPYERHVEISKEIAKDFFEKNKDDLFKNVNELKDNFIGLYEGLLNKLKREWIIN